MAFDIAGARSAGYSDAEIADFLGAQRKFDVAQARSAGYSDSEILAHLATTEKKGGIGTPAQFLRGLAPGAVGLAESAATGLSSVLPESMEAPVRQAIKSTAETLRAPFAEAPGREDTILRRLGESVGSTAPFFALGPLGVAGRLGALGLGVGAGAGEARVRAEQAGATSEQRAQATGLGALVGTTEMLPVFAFLNRLGTAGEGIKATLRRALITGGQEGAQEAAANIAQNLIAKGLYDPQQGVFTDTGEALGYGAGTGALVSALTDLVLGSRRRRGAAEPSPAATEEPAVPAPAAPDLAQMSTAQLYQEEGRLAALLDENRQQPEVAQRIKELRELRRQREIADIETLRAQRATEEADAARAAETSLGQAEPVQGEFREMALAPWEERQLARQMQPEPEPEPEATAPAAAEPTTAEPTGEQLEFPGFMPVTRELLEEAGLPAKPKTPQQKGVAAWMEENVVGKSMEDVQALVAAQPDLTKKPGLRSQILRNITTVTPPPFAGESLEQLPEPEVSESVVPVTGGREPSVGVPEAGVGERGGATAAPGVPAPAGVGVGAAGEPVAARDATEGGAPAALKSAAEPPLKANLTPEKEQTLRAQLADLRERMRAVEVARDAAERDLALAELTGNQEAAKAAFDAQERARLALKKLTTDADRAYWRLYDKEASEAQAKEGERLQEADEAAREARRTADMNVPLRQRRGEYPYNLTTVQAVHDELRDQLSHTPEYKKFIEKNFKPNRTLRAGRTDAKVIAEGQKLLDRMVFQKQASGAGTSLTPDIIAELENNNIAAALSTLAETTTDPAYKALATRLIPLLRNTHVEISPQLVNKEGERAAGAASTNGNAIWLDRELGLNEETLLHESVHAATERIIAKESKDRTAAQNVALKELDALWAAAKADADITLGADAQGSLSEFVTEALTNPELVKQLKQKPWTLKNAWESFKQILLKALGVRFPANMYDAAMASMDTVFSPTLPRGAEPSTPARFQSAPKTAEELLAEMRTKPEKQSLRAMINGAFGGPGKGEPGANSDYVASWEARIRTRLSDRAATVFDGLQDAVNKGMISATQSKTVQVLFKQAEAANQLVPEFLRRGGIARDPVGGWRAEAQGRAPAEVFPLIEAWGKKRGLTMDAAWTDAARLMESGRQFVFREHNRNLKAGDPKLPQSMKDADIDMLYPAYKVDKDLAEIKKILDDARFRLIDQMVEVGRLSKDMAAEWKDASEYIPFDRMTDEELGRYETVFRKKKKVGTGLSSLGGLPALVNAKWVNRPVGNALENYFGTLGWMMQQVVRTDALNKTLEQLQAIKQAQPAGFVQPASRNIAKTYRDGRAFYYEVPSIHHAFAFNSTVAPLPEFLRVFGTISRVLRTSITALPTFTAAQLPQDIQRAIILSGVRNPAELTKRVLHNFKELSQHALKGTLPTAPLIADLHASGVVGDVDFRANDPARSLLEEFGYASPTLLKSKVAGKLLHRMNELSRSGDIAVRQAIYDQTLKETNDRLLALQRAREIINFRTTGAGDALNILPFMIQTIPFTNAFIQGTDVLYRGIVGRGAVSGVARRQALIKFYTMAGSLSAFSALYALAMAGDDDYENMALEERDKTWILGGGLSLPVPGEIGMIFKAIPERAVEAFLKYGTPDEAAGMTAITSWFRATAMEYRNRLLPIPSAVRPLIEAWTDYSFRLDRKLEGVYQAGLPVHQRVTSNTSEFAREIARFAHATGIDKVVKATLNVDLSPIKIDNTLQGYFGTTAAMVLATADALTSDRADRPLHRIVGLTPFTYDPVGTRHVGEFYDLREKVVQSQNALNDLVKNDPEQAIQFAEKNKELLILYRAVNGTLNQLKKTRDYKNWLDTEAAAAQFPGDERLKMKQEVQAYEQKLVAWNREARKALGI